MTGMPWDPPPHLTPPKTTAEERRKSRDKIKTPAEYRRIESSFQRKIKELAQVDARKEYYPLYDVFLSFRGEDTRGSFTSHLRNYLQNAGIYVFMDDDALPRGDDISKSLPTAIENSQISVIVFSRNYADSRWCMQELDKIMKCHRTTGQVVLPVFYDVDPSEVRHQTGDFGKSFNRLLSRISLDQDKSLSWRRLFSRNSLHQDESLNWREALRQAASLSGFVVLNCRNDSEAIEDVVENITRLLDKTDLFVADKPVGVDSRVQDIIRLLDSQQPKDVLLVGIWGMGGIGKTTIARAVYNEIGRKFEGRSFLANVRDVWEQDAGKVYLQERILFDIYKRAETKIYSVELGINILKERLRRKRVLVVFDDVSTLDQLNSLCGSREWFGPGSRIIITTRDEHILRVHSVDHLYRMKEMDESESIELFSWHAFKQASPIDGFEGLSRNVVAYSGGLPLALEVLGSYLFNRGLTEWRSALEKLKRIPNDQVQKKLKISFDGLNDDKEKDIFLDIACYFIGMDRNDVIHILNGCGYFAEIGVTVLVERSLVTVDRENKIGMHDLLRDMGREIIREKSPKEPEERSRLWFHEDVLDVLLKKTGTKAVEGLSLKLPITNTKCFVTKAFENMKRLRLLELAGVRLEGDFEYLSTDLRWLSWHGFPLTSIPTNFYQEKLVSIELENSSVKTLERGSAMVSTYLERLKRQRMTQQEVARQPTAAEDEQSRKRKSAAPSREAGRPSSPQSERRTKQRRDTPVPSRARPEAARVRPARVEAAPAETHRTRQESRASEAARRAEKGKEKVVYKPGNTASDSEEEQASLVPPPEQRLMAASRDAARKQTARDQVARDPPRGEADDLSLPRNWDKGPMVYALGSHMKRPKGDEWKEWPSSSIVVRHGDFWETCSTEQYMERLPRLPAAAGALMAFCMSHEQTMKRILKTHAAEVANLKKKAQAAEELFGELSAVKERVAALERAAEQDHLEFAQTLSKETHAKAELGAKLERLEAEHAAELAEVKTSLDLSQKMEKLAMNKVSEYSGLNTTLQLENEELKTEIGQVRKANSNLRSVNGNLRTELRVAHAQVEILKKKEEAASEELRSLGDVETNNKLCFGNCLLQAQIQNPGFVLNLRGISPLHYVNLDRKVLDVFTDEEVNMEDPNLPAFDPEISLESLKPAGERYRGDSSDEEVANPAIEAEGGEVGAAAVTGKGGEEGPSTAEAPSEATTAGAASEEQNVRMMETEGSREPAINNEPEGEVQNEVSQPIPESVPASSAEVPSNPSPPKAPVEDPVV